MGRVGDTGTEMAGEGDGCPETEQGGLESQEEKGCRGVGGGAGKLLAPALLQPPACRSLSALF